MQVLTAKKIAEYIEGELIGDCSNSIASGVAIDSRDVKKNDVFFALKGEVTDGHRFLQKATDNGASILVVREFYKDINICQIVVGDTFIALQRLAKAYKNLFNIPYVAITGSSGKTTTKDIIAGVLAQKYQVLKTKGNLNSTTGVPLTLFDLSDRHEIAVIEMSMSHPGEILANAEIVRPNIAVITNIGLCHIEFLGTQENIFKAKSEILAYLTKDDIAVVNGEDPFLKSIKARSYQTIRVGIDNGEYIAKNIRHSNECVTFTVDIRGNEESISFPIPGQHNVINALLAIAVGLQYGLTIDQIQTGLNTYQSSKHRMEIFNHKGVTLINDTYNANPDAMKAAIDVLVYLSNENGKKIAVLGDMYELGEASSDMHEICGRYAAEKGIDLLILTGQYAADYQRGYNQSLADGECLIFDDKESLTAYCLKNIQKDDTVLFKASRGMQLEKVFLSLKENM